MIKKLKNLLTFIVIGLGIINFSNASYTQTFEVNIEGTIQDGRQNSFELTNNGNFLLNGNYKVFTLKSPNGTFYYNFFRTEDGLYMMYGNANLGANSPQMQGYLYGFCEFNNLVNGNNSGCYETSSSLVVASDFYSNDNFKNPNILNYYIDDYGQYLDLCFGYTEIGKQYCRGYNRGQNTKMITGSLNLTYNPTSNTDFENGYLNNYITNSLRTSGGGGGSGDSGGSSEGFVPLPSSYVCPTVGQLINQYDSSVYNTGLCYSSSLVYSGNSIVSVTPSSLFDLFSSRSDFNSYSNLYFSYCSNSVMNGSQCSTAFSGKDLQYSLLSKAYSSGKVKPGYLYEYCNLSLNYTLETSTCVGTGITINPSDISSDNIINSLVGGDYTIVSPLSGSIVSDVLSGDYYTGDIISAVDTLFTSFTSLFSQQTGNTTGFLPGYIIVALLVIILFKFFKK